MALHKPFRVERIIDTPQDAYGLEQALRSSYMNLSCELGAMSIRELADEPEFALDPVISNAQEGAQLHRFYVIIEGHRR